MERFAVEPPLVRRSGQEKVRVCVDRLQTDGQDRGLAKRLVAAIPWMDKPMPFIVEWD